jgi:phage gp16-like protein
MACPYQRFIKTAQRNLGLDDDTYRDFLENVTGKRSTTRMTVRQRWRVAEELKAKGMPFESRTKTGKKDADKDDGDQSRLVRHLWLKLKGYGVLRDSSEWVLLSYVERITGRKRLEWCGVRQIRDVTETLKKWVARVERDIIRDGTANGLLPDPPTLEQRKAFLDSHIPAADKKSRMRTAP